MLYCDAITDAMTKGLGQQKACVRYNIITSALDVIFLFILLPKFGMNGYFFSFLVTHLLNFILSLRRLLMIAGNVISAKAPILMLIATAASVFAASHLTFSAGQAVAFTLAFGCLLVLLQVVGKEDIRWFQGLIYRKTTCQ